MKLFIKTFDAEIAWMSFRNVFAIIGFFGWMAYLSTMNWYLVIPCIPGTVLVWLFLYMQYQRTEEKKTDASA